MEFNVDAVAEWIEMGTTSLRNPAYKFGLDLYVKPFGVRCDYAEFSPETVDSRYLLLPHLVSATFTLSDVHRDLLPFFPPERIKDYFVIGFDCDVFKVRKLDGAPESLVAVIAEYQEGAELKAAWLRSRAAYSRFVRACLAKLEKIETEEEYRLWHDDVQTFCEKVVLATKQSD